MRVVPLITLAILVGTALAAEIHSKKMKLNKPILEPILANVEQRDFEEMLVTGETTTLTPETTTDSAAVLPFGRSFAVAFGPVPGGHQDGDCAILLMAPDATFFTIRGVDSFLNGVIQAGETYRYNVQCSFRTTAGVERKVYYVQSNKTISVVAVNNPASDWNDMEATAVYPITNDNTEFYLVTFTNQAGNTNGCPSTGTRTFFTIAAFEDGTQIHVHSYPTWTLQVDVTLQRFQVYTYAYTGQVQQDFSGWQVVANKPVSVTSGNVCTQASFPQTTTTNEPGLTWNFIPPVATLDSGTHISFDIYNPSSAATCNYAILALAIQDNTTVLFAGVTQRLLNRGQITHYNGSTVPFSVRCDSPCLVMQVNNNYARNTGVFMVHVPGLSSYDQDAVFSPVPVGTGGTTVTQYVRIVAPISPPVDINIVGLQEVQPWACGNANVCHYLGSFQSAVSPPARIYATTGSAANFTAMIYMSDKLGEGFGYNAHVPQKPISPAWH